MVSNVNYSPNSYGNLQKIGQMQNGRTVYRIIDSQGVEAGKITLPSEDSDKFETAYKDIMETAPKIQDKIAAIIADAIFCQIRPGAYVQLTFRGKYQPGHDVFEGLIDVIIPKTEKF